MPAIKTNIAKTHEKISDANQKLFSAAESAITEMKLDGKVADMLIGLLGDDFTYPDYDQYASKTSEKRINAERITDAFGKKEMDKFLAGLVVGTGELEHWEIGKMDRAQLHKAISTLLEGEDAGKITLAMAHMLGYELQNEIIEAHRSMQRMGSMMDDDENEEDDTDMPEMGFYRKLMSWCISVEASLSKADDRCARGMDYSKRFRQSFRDLLIIDQAVEITPYEAESYYLDAALRDRKGLHALFVEDEREEPEGQNLKEAARKKSDNDNMFV